MSGGRGRPMTCDDCGATTLRRSPSQRYCATCSAARDTQRKRVWGEKHGHSSERRPYTELQSAMVAAGADRSLGSRGHIGWNANEPINWRVQRRVAVPFDYAASKNAVWRTGRGGHTYARRESTAWQNGLALLLQRGDDQWFQGKLWIDIFVEKPNHRGDAINVVDLVCDAIKVATGVDDRWYSITRLDWSIVKQQPRIIVGVCQAITEDHQVCSHCGRDLPLASSFGRNRTTKTGFTRVCRDCSAPKRSQEEAAA